MTRLGFVRRSILNERRSLAAALWAAAIVLVATALRALLEPWVVGLPFLTYFPAVLVAALFLGWRWGLAVVAASALTANFAFFAPGLRWSLGFQEIVGTAAFAASAALIVATAAALRTAVRDLDLNARRESALNAELQHRVKNNLAVVQGLARQTARSARDPDQFYEAFRGRLLALAEAHDVLSSGNWEQCHLPDLARAALKPFEHRGATRVDGPSCIIPATSCVPLMLALHELATNAVKYGALSAPTGQVSLSWALAEREVAILWREAGGPPVVAPRRKGLGSRLLVKQAGLDEVRVDFLAEGVVCEIKIRDAKLR